MSTRDRKTHGPLYALEHPLTPSECDALTKQLRVTCKQEGLRSDHWLTWIVIATEFGYSYSGSDYWPRLEARIPDFEYSDRNRLTSWFERFAKEYGGARPSGAWARQFCLIAWPITHAILPSDLQVQLSRAIYTARHYLFGLEDRSDAELGRIVASRWVPHGDRFERLMQREEFVGTLVRLLLQPKADAAAISQHALKRIVADVESHSDARSWLRDARAYCKPTAKVASPAPRVMREEAALRPRFSPELLFEKDEQQRWRLWVQPGSMVGLIADAPQLRRSLARLRFAVAGNDSQAFAASELDRGAPRKRPMRALPAPGTPVLRFLPADDSDAALLTQDCIFAARDVWLFKVRSDGSAWLQATSTVTAGSSYLFATENADRKLPGVAVDAATPGLRLFHAQMPAMLSHAEVEALDAAGLSVAKRTTLRPWGVLPRVWRDDGLVEYVLGEPILLQVERDHAFDAIRVCVDTGPAVEMPCVEPGNFLLEIAGLPLGDHRLAVDTLLAQRAGSVTTISTLASAILEVHVRPPSEWQPGALPAEALALSLAPTEPTLDQLLHGTVDLAIEGSATDTLDVSLAILDSSGDRHDLSILRRKPPLAPADWHHQLEVALRDSDVSLFALAATHAYLAISSANFGWHRAELAVFPKPLRWSIDRDGSDFRLKLHTDAADAPQVTFFARDAPCAAQAVDFEAVHRGCVGRDGLHTASVSGCTAALVVSSPPAKFGFGQLGALGAPRVEESDPARLLESLCQWAEAPTVGRLAQVRLTQVIDAIRIRLVLQLAGSRWSSAERLLSRHGRLSDLDTVVEPNLRNYGINLGQWRGLQDTAQLKSNFVATSTRYGVTADPGRAEFAWRLVFDPCSLRGAPSAGHFADPALPALVRGARLIELGLKTGKEK